MRKIRAIGLRSVLVVASLVGIAFLWTGAVAPGANPPTLSWVDTGNTGQPYFDEGVNPDFGTTSTGFVFKVVYRDPDNDSPTFVRAIVDGTTYAMVSENPSCLTYTTGCVYAVTLSISMRGWFTHHFEASDGLNVVRFPSSNEAAGPLVGDGTAADVVLQYMNEQDTEYAPFDHANRLMETYLPMAGHLDTMGDVHDYMFDGNIFYDGRLYAGAGNRFGNVGTQLFVDSVLPNSNPCSDSALGILPICNLDKSVRIVRSELGNSNFRFGIFVAAPIPCRFGTGTYGDSCAGGLTAQQNTAYNRIQQVIDRFNAVNPQGLSLIGFYQGYTESLSSPSDDATLVQNVASYLHNRGLKFLWIPWCNAAGLSTWQSFGLDWVTVQPNYAWVQCTAGAEDGDDYTQVFSEIDQDLDAYGLAGVEFEIAHETRQYEDIRSNARAYLDAGFEYQWDTNLLNTWFTEGVTLMSALVERDLYPELRETYDRTYSFVRTPSNVAFRKTASADYSWPGWEASKAVDGPIRTYWSTFGQGTWPHWWKVDLGSSMFVSKATLVYDVNYAYRLRLEGSTNDVSYTLISDRTGVPNLSPQVFSNIAASYRYLKVTFTARDWGPYDIAHLREVSVALSDWGSVYEYFPREDSYTVESNPTGTCGSCPELKIGATESPLSRFHAYLKFDIRSAYLSPGTIRGAYIYLSYNRIDAAPAAGTPHQFVSAYHVGTDTWSESTLSWSNAPGEDSAYPLDPHLVFGVEKHEKVGWEITYKVRQDIDGTLTFELRRLDDSTYLLELGWLRSKEYIVTDGQGYQWGSSFWPFLVIVT